MDLTNKGDCVSNATTFFQICHNLAPDVTVFGEKVKVADAVKPYFGTRERHACTVDCLDEAHLLVLVAAHQRQKDDVIFFALEVVNGRQANTFKFSVFEAVSHGKHLSRIGCQKCYLLSLVALLK